MAATGFDLTSVVVVVVMAVLDVEDLVTGTDIEEADSFLLFDKEGPLAESVLGNVAELARSAFVLPTEGRFLLLSS